jgi:photosystem II stability/assembly factor-like uncharacterized protein
MNMIKKSLLIFTSVIFSLTIVFSPVFGQYNPNQKNNITPMRLVMPMAYPMGNNYGVENNESVVSNGAFDFYQVSTNNGFAESNIAANPSNPLNFIATDNRITGFSGPTYVYYTTDGGVTWAPTTSGLSSNAGDPVLAFDGQNNAYLAVLFGSGTLAVRVYKSVNGGASWTLLGNLNGGGSYDKEWIACDQTQGTYKNNVYVVHVDFGAGTAVQFWRSTNNGSTWSQSNANIGGGAPNPGPAVIVDKNGKVYAAYYNGSGSSVRYSVDGGATFSTGVTAAAYGQPGSYSSVSGRYYVKNYIRVNGMPHLAVDKSNGPYSGYLYMSYMTNPPGPKLSGVFVVRSTDGGATFGSPVMVPDDGTALDNWMEDISVDASGRVWCFWWDSRDDPANIQSETWASVSTDGGQTWAANFKIDNPIWNPNSIEINQGTQHYYLGDYQGIASNMGTGTASLSMPFFVGPYTSLQDFTAYLPDYGLSFQHSIDYVSPGFTESNRVVFPLHGPYAGTVNLSATVSPNPTQGTLTVNFVGGNTKTFNGNPDSVQINCVASSNLTLGTYSINITAADQGGPRTHSRNFGLFVVTGVEKNGQTAYKFALDQNYPNPFNPTTEINYSVEKQSLVNLVVYDALGREVATVIKNQLKPVGSYSVSFNAANLPSGIYFYKLTAGDFTDVKKMTLLK